jgi:hypothetical protein
MSRAKKHVWELPKRTWSPIEFNEKYLKKSVINRKEINKEILKEIIRQAKDDD